MPHTSTPSFKAKVNAGAEVNSQWMQEYCLLQGWGLQPCYLEEAHMEILIQSTIEKDSVTLACIDCLQKVQALC